MSSARAPKVVLFDAGNTLVFLDHDALADAARTAGLSTTGAALRATEPVAKQQYESALTAGMSHEAGWHLYVETIFTAAGVPLARAREATLAARRAHDEFNLWRKVPADLRPALDEGKRAGLRYGVVQQHAAVVGRQLGQRYVGEGTGGLRVLAYLARLDVAQPEGGDQCLDHFDFLVVKRLIGPRDRNE